MKYLEWESYPHNPDEVKDICPGYIISEDAKFIMEPAFYGQLENLKPLHPDKFNLVIDAINKRVIKEKKVFFVYDFERPFFEIEGYVYLELTDILNPLKIFVEDKSRGSDYGD